MPEPEPIAVADMIGKAIADGVPTLTAVRPVVPSSRDAYPWAVYETVDMRSKRYLNCPSKQFDGTVRIHICGRDYAEVSSIIEQVKDIVLALAATGVAYRIRRCYLIDETDVTQQEDDDKNIFYTKSVDFEVKAIKL